MPSQEIIKMALTVASRDAGIDQRKFLSRSMGTVQFQQHGVSSHAGPTFKTANTRGSGHFIVRPQEGKTKENLWSSGFRTVKADFTSYFLKYLSYAEIVFKVTFLV